MNPLESLNEYGQSVWLDYIQRQILATGELKRLTEEDGLKGVTSNPAIFEKAIAESDDYDDMTAQFSAEGKADPKAVYEKIAIRDIQEAADVLKPVYDETRSRDGYVSLEVSPHLAHDTEGTLNEARRLWKSVSRDNLLIKVPGTPEGVPAIEQLISEGISVNVTLLFAQEAYEQVAQAYLRGLTKAAASGLDVSKIAIYLDEVCIVREGQRSRDYQEQQGVKVMKRVRCRGSALEACVTRHGTIVGPLMTELVGFKQLVELLGARDLCWGWISTPLSQ